MKKYWTSNTGSAESFWEHEWDKHGTCISTLDPNCYTDYQPTEEVPDFFQRTVSLFKTLPSYQWLSDAGITPSSSKTYSVDAIQAALSKNHDGKKVYIGCNNNELDEIWYFYNVRGSLQTGEFVPADSLTDSSCTGSSIQYLPKSGGGSGGGGSPTSSGDGFTLKSSKGDCAVSEGKLICGSGVGSASSFSSDGSSLAYNSGSSFYADAVPSGSTQGTVYTGNSGHNVTLTIEWQSI